MKAREEERESYDPDDPRHIFTHYRWTYYNFFNRTGVAAAFPCLMVRNWEGVDDGLYCVIARTREQAEHFARLESSHPVWAIPLNDLHWDDHFDYGPEVDSDTLQEILDQ